MQVTLIIPADYVEMEKLFREHKADLAYFGGATFVRARRESDAIPIAMRDVDLRFTTTFISAKSNQHPILDTFRGKRFSFGSKQSTSGHLMPRYFLEEMGYIPENFFSEVLYSGAHDRTVELVKNGEVDLGAVNTYVLDKLFSKSQYKRDDFNVVWVTQPYPDYTWAVRPTMNAEIRARLQKAFFSLDPNIAEHASILADQSAGGFLPVNNSDFDRLEKVMDRVK